MNRHDASDSKLVMAHTERWYAVCCKPRQEAIAEENLLRQGYHTYLPRIHNTRRRKGQWVNTIEPLFPRYIFIRIDPTLHNTAPVRSTRGAIGLVRFGGQPAEVPEQVIDTIRQRADATSGIHHDSHPLFRAGEQIRLVDGPLAGMEGIFAEEDAEKRAVVLLELLGKVNRIKVHRDWVITDA